MAFLREVNGPREFALQRKVTVIGRDPSSDIVVANPGTSKRHAMILQSAGAFFIEDLDSANGTFVNGRQIRERTRLRPGDQLEVYGLVSEFHDDQPGNAREGHQTTILKLSQTPPPSVLGSIALAEGPRVGVAPETKLRAVLEISRNVANTLDLKEILPKILEGLFAIFPQAERGYILLRDPETAQLVPRAVRHRREDDVGSRPAFSRTIVNYALASGRAVLSADAGQDSRFDLSQSVHSLRIRSVMCVPMLDHKGESLGVIQIDTPSRRDQFTQEDLDVLVSASAQAAQAVELARLHQERRDLETAAQIQKSFLPAERPQAAGLRFFDYYASALHIGGDYYDYIPLPGNRLAVALGDVSGKGVSAALLMARLSSAVRFSLATTPSLPQAIRQLNTMFIRRGTEDRFVTFIVAVIDLNTFTMRMVNAGHMPALRRRAGRAEVEEVGDSIVGLPLGVIDRPYEELTLPLEPGDLYLFYTDGVSEARNPEKDLYGPERLRAAVEGAVPDAEAVVTAVLEDVRHFAAGRPPNDDIAMVCFERLR